MIFKFEKNSKTYISEKNTSNFIVKNGTNF